jgi:hypothetical protein
MAVFGHPDLDDVGAGSGKTLAAVEFPAQGDDTQRLAQRSLLT